MNSALGRSPQTAAAPIPAGEACVLCGCRLTTPYLIERGLCGSCSDRAEAKALPRDPGTGRVLPRQPAPPRAPAAFGPLGTRQPRPFTIADKSLIKALHGQIATSELLRILNDRLVADVRTAHAAYTLDQLHAHITTIADPMPAGDWNVIRQAITQARASGVLAAITLQTVEDFAVVFQLSPAQLLHVKDVIVHAKEDR